MMQLKDQNDEPCHKQPDTAGTCIYKASGLHWQFALSCHQKCPLTFLINILNALWDYLLFSSARILHAVRIKSGNIGYIDSPCRSFSTTVSLWGKFNYGERSNSFSVLETGRVDTVKVLLLGEWWASQNCMALNHVTSQGLTCMPSQVCSCDITHRLARVLPPVQKIVPIRHVLPQPNNYHTSMAAGFHTCL